MTRLRLTTYHIKAKYGREFLATGANSIFFSLYPIAGNEYPAIGAEEFEEQL